VVVPVTPIHHADLVGSSLEMEGRPTRDSAGDRQLGSDGHGFVVLMMLMEVPVRSLRRTVPSQSQLRAGTISQFIRT
jgi:hypothetical protein